MSAPHTSLTTRLRPLALACAALVAAQVEAAPAKDETLRLLEKMNARLEQLEKRNAELERQIKANAQQAAAPVALEERLKTLEETQARVVKGLDSDNISENEPELTYRLKAIEKDSLAVKKAAKKIDALDGLKAGMSLTTVAQRPSGLPKGTENGNSQLNYRADVTVELPLTPIGDTEHKVFAHVRIGQGQGLNAPMSALGAFGSAPNAVAFRASGASPDDSVAILGQAYYQASIPLPFGGFKPRSREKLELTFGKMDLFGFFDQKEHDSRGYIHFSGNQTFMLFSHNGYPVLYRETETDSGGSMSERKRLDIKGGVQFVDRYVGGKDYKAIMLSGDGTDGAGEQRPIEEMSAANL